MKRREAQALGLDKYNTGKMCSNGHNSDRYTKTGQCIPCLTEWKERNKEKVKRYEKAYALSDEGRRSSRASSLKHYYNTLRGCEASESQRISKQKWKESNKDKINCYANKRRAAKLMSIPKWYDAKKVAKIYKMARTLNMEVDHIVPLLSDRVSGLHTWENLQLLDGSLNRSKGNRVWPDM